MTERKASILYFIIAILFFFCTVRYLGIRIDGELYTLQVIHNWFPERFVGDVSFMYGNQDSFTIFSHFYGIFLKLFPVDCAAKYVCLISQLCFAVTFAYFLKNFLGCRLDQKYIVVVFLTVFITYVAGSDKAELYFMQFVEAYPVPRTLSVALGIAGITFMIKNYRWISLALIVVGCLFHPLMAGWALALWVVFFFPQIKIPLICVSSLLPFSSLLKIGPFDSYSDGWLTNPLLYSPNFAYFVRYSIYFCLATAILKRWPADSKLRKLLSAFIVVLGISFYWYLSSCFIRNIFVYQIQPWRVEWLCIILEFPFLCLILIEIIKKVKQSQKLHIWDIAFLCLSVTVFSDSQNIDGLLLSLIFFMKKNRPISSRIMIFLGVAISVTNIFVSNLIEMFWSGLDLGDLVDYKLLCSIQMRYVMLASLMNLVLGICALLQKQYLRLAISLSYIIFPQVLILPLINAIYSLLKKRWVYCLLVVAIADVILGAETRVTCIAFNAIEKKQIVLTLLAITCALPFFLEIKNGWKKILWITPFLSMCPYVLANYDQREDSQREAEYGIEQFKKKTIFPQIQERSKIFFYRSGEMIGSLRTMFLTGSYFDLGSNSGGVFLKQQYDEIRRRECLTVYKLEECEPDIDFSVRQIFVYEFLKKRLVNTDSLIDRIEFLCGKREISYLATTCANLPFMLLDSSKVNGFGESMCLYACPKEQ